MATPRFSILILCYTRSDLLTERLEEIGHHCRPFGGVEVIVGDNGSPNRAPSLAVAERLLIGFPFALSSHRITPNQGFGRAFNRLIDKAEGQVIVCLSDDVEVRGDFLTPLDLAVSLDSQRLFCHRIVDWPAGWNQFGGEMAVAYPEGYFLAATRQVWTKLGGGFDERYYPSDYEDVDLGMKAKEAGIPVYAVPNMRLRHISAQTIGHSPERMSQTVAMRALFAEKWGLNNEPARP